MTNDFEDVIETSTICQLYFNSTSFHDPATCPVCVGRHRTDPSESSDLARLLPDEVHKGGMEAAKTTNEITEMEEELGFNPENMTD